MSLLQTPGDLAQTPLAAVLIEALNVRATGVLEVAHGGGTSRLWFRDGRPVGAQVFEGFRPLGKILLQAGKIDIDALSASLSRVQKTGRPQGELLVEMGAVTPEDVHAALAEQQAGYFRLIAALDVGAFRFDPVPPVPEWTRGSRLSPLRTIVDALERPQAAALVGAALQPVAASGVRLSSAYAAVAEAVRWSDAERKLVDRIASPEPIEIFFASSQVAPERARAMLAALLLLGLAVPADVAPEGSGELAIGLRVDAEWEAEQRAGRRTAAAPRPAAAAAPTPRPGPQTPTPGPQTPTPGPQTPTPGPLRDSDAARARRQRLLQQAIRNMGVGPFAARPAGGTPSPAGGPPPAAPGGPAGGGKRPAATPDEVTLRDALLEVAPRARERNLFARLAIEQTAGRDEVKKAYLAIARQFHPDRFSSAALADLQETVRDFFAAVNEAYEVLSDDKRRAAYLAERKGKQAANAEAAKVDFRKGEACLRTRDLARARGFFEAAIRVDRRAEYLAALAQTYLADPARKDVERARPLLAEATKDRACDRAHLVAGMLARDEGDAGAAERCFRAAIEANPRNADAARELRAIQARRSDKRR
jgi:tetratricopeptide (TPR) repeat protein